MRVILTGDRQQGKSTLCRKLAAELREAGLSVGGVVTERKQNRNEVSLIAHDLLDETAAILARTDWKIKGQQQGPFVFSPEGLYLGIKAIGKGMRQDLLVIDEIGPLEMSGRGFFPALHAIRKARQVLLVIRPTLIAHFMEALKLDDSYQIIILTEENRNDLLEALKRDFLGNNQTDEVH